MSSVSKKIYIFGDSFSKNFSTCQIIDKEKSWPYLLSEKLNLEIVDCAKSGISNDGILHTIYSDLNFEDCEFAVFGLTFFFRMHDFYKNMGIDLKMNDDILLKSGLEEYEIEFYKQKLINETQHHNYLRHQFEQFHFIFRTLKFMNKKFIFWSLDNTDVHFFQKLISDFRLNFMTSPVETNDWFWPFINKNQEWGQFNGDKHFGEYGHKQFFQYLYQYIQQPKLI